MSRVIVLDTGPLSLVTQRQGVAAGDACRAWLAQHLLRGVRVVVPEVADFEVRRELLRAGKVASVARLDALNAAQPDRYLPLTTAAMRRAAELWAQARQSGTPTADPKELDGDVILAAQALLLASPPVGFVVATTNVAHLTLFCPADLWANI